MFILYYLDEPILENYLNFQPSSEFTLDYGHMNPVTPTLYGLEQNQTGNVINWV